MFIAAFYLVAVFACHGRFEWHRDKPGYYDWLGRAFAEGHLNLPVQPKPELLALPDPWDPARNGPYMVRDLALYNGRYYLYHGATPACLLFAPYRFATHHDMPESFAAYLFSVLGYLSCCGILLHLWAAGDSRPGLFRFSVLLLLMGICNSMPYLLARVLVYEVALTGGFFCVAAGFYFLACWLLGPRRYNVLLALGGLMLGLAVGCRPHLGLAALLAALALWWCIRKDPRFTRQILFFIFPIALCSVLIAWYNFARFGQPFEFGVRYVLGSEDYRGISSSFRNVPAGLFYLALCPPTFEPVFPFVRMVTRLRFHSAGIVLPARYFLEPIAGVLAIWPLAILTPAALLPALQRKNRAVTALIALALALPILSLFFVATLGLATHRFHADWLPYLVLLTCFVLGAIRFSRRKVAAAAAVLCAIAVLYSVVVNLAVALQGPDDMFVQIRPADYVKLARLFSPVPHFRPLLNPPLRVTAAYEFPARIGAGVLPLVTAGRFGTRYVLSAQMLGENRLRLTSATAPRFGTVVSAETDLMPGVPNRLRLDYRPRERAVTLQWNGALVLRHEIPFLVTAPAQITVGEDGAETDSQPLYFPGRILARDIFIGRDAQDP